MVGARYKLKEVADETGDYVKHTDHLAALEAAKKEAVVEWLKSQRKLCRDMSKIAMACIDCGYNKVCTKIPEDLTDEDIKKAAEV